MRLEERITGEDVIAPDGIVIAVRHFRNAHHRDQLVFPDVCNEAVPHPQCAVLTGREVAVDAALPFVAGIRHKIFVSIDLCQFPQLPVRIGDCAFGRHGHADRFFPHAIDQFPGIFLTEKLGKESDRFAAVADDQTDAGLHFTPQQCQFKGSFCAGFIPGDLLFCQFRFAAEQFHRHRTATAFMEDDRNIAGRIFFHQITHHFFQIRQTLFLRCTAGAEIGELTEGQDRIELFFHILFGIFTGMGTADPLPFQDHAPDRGILRGSVSAAEIPHKVGRFAAGFAGIGRHTAVSAVKNDLRHIFFAQEGALLRDQFGGVGVVTDRPGLEDMFHFFLFPGGGEGELIFRPFHHIAIQILHGPDQAGIDRLDRNQFGSDRRRFVRIEHVADAAVFHIKRNGAFDEFDLVHAHVRLLQSGLVGAGDVVIILFIHTAQNFHVDIAGIFHKDHVLDLADGDVQRNSLQFPGFRAGERNCGFRHSGGGASAVVPETGQTERQIRGPVCCTIQRVSDDRFVVLGIGDAAVISIVHGFKSGAREVTIALQIEGAEIFFAAGDGEAVPFTGGKIHKGGDRLYARFFVPDDQCLICSHFLCDSRSARKNFHGCNFALHGKDADKVAVDPKFMFFYFNDKSGFRGGSAVLFQICSDPALFKFFKTPLEFRQSKDIQRKSAQHRAADCHTAVRDPDDRLDRLDLFDQFAVLQFRNLLELRFLVSLLERLKIQDNRACLHILPDLYCDPYRIDFGRDLDRRSFDDHAFCGDQAAFFRNFFHMDIIQPDVVPAGKIDTGKAPIFFHETAAGILHFSVPLHVEIHSAAAGNEFHILPLPVTRSGRERGNIFVYSNGADRNLCRRPERGAVGIVQVDHDRFPDFRIFRGKGEI